MASNVYQKAAPAALADARPAIAKASDERDTPKLRLPKSRGILWAGGAVLLLVFAAAYYLLMPVAEVAAVRRGTAISAVYGTVRIEPAFVVRVRAQNDGFIRLAEPFPRAAAR